MAGDGIITTGVCFVGGPENNIDLEVSGWGVGGDAIDQLLSLTGGNVPITALCVSPVAVDSTFCYMTYIRNNCSYTVV